MVKIFDILRDGIIISAKYCVVGYKEQGFISVNVSTEERVEWIAPEGEAGHPWFAHLVLRKLCKFKELYVLPSKAVVDVY